MVTQAGDFAARGTELLGLVPLPEGVAPLQEASEEVESVAGRSISLTVCSREGVTGFPDNLTVRQVGALLQIFW